MANNDLQITKRSFICSLSYLKFNFKSIDVSIVGFDQNFTFDHFLTVVNHAQARSKVIELISSQNPVD